MRSRLSSPRRRVPGIVGSLAVALCLVLASPVGAEIRITHLSVFLNDLDVTVEAVALGAILPSLHESLHSGVPTHLRFTVELWQYSRLWVERRLQTRTVERQLTYNVLSREYKLVSLAGEQREPYLSKDLRDVQRVASELRAVKLAPVASLDPGELVYVRVRADVSLNGVNSWFARLVGDAAETPWARSSLLTPLRVQ